MNANLVAVQSNVVELTGGVLFHYMRTDIPAQIADQQIKPYWNLILSLGGQIAQTTGSQGQQGQFVRGQFAQTG